MKRYRVLLFDFDSRATALAFEIEKSSNEHSQQPNSENRQRLEESLLKEFGEEGSKGKLRDLLELGSAPFSVLAFHHRFLRQIRTAFVMGAYYPALTASCALGERILNHLILLLREDYQNTPEYKAVYSKKSFDHWDRPINALEAWGVLLPDTVLAFRNLRDIRNQALHFDPQLDTNDRDLALAAIRVLNQIIIAQFSALGVRPWFIPGVRGECYIKKEAEKQPFVRKVYLPHCALVGPYHTLRLYGNRWHINDNHKYEDREITDEEFVELRTRGK